MIASGVSKHLLHDFVRSIGEGDCHIALLSKDAHCCPDDAVFTGQGEVRATGYGAGGKRLTGFSCGLEDGIAWIAFNNAEWMNATIKASGAVIYQKTKDNRIVTVLEFDEEKSSSQGLFRVKFPPPGAKDAIFWLS
jgi:hypothetical protein